MLILILFGCTSGEAIPEIQPSQPPADKPFTTTPEQTPVPPPTALPAPADPNMAPAMKYHSAIYNTRAERLLIFGGNSKHGFNADIKEVFFFDPVNHIWEDPTAFEASPAWKSAMAPAYDTESGRAILLNVDGETWAYEYEPGTWELMKPDLSPSGRCGYQMSYDSESDRIIMYGGFKCATIADPMMAETWAYDYNTNTWTSQSTGPSARIYHQMAYDSESDRVVMWGGRPHEELGDTDIWAYDFNTDSWDSYKVENGPSHRKTYHTMEYIPELDRIIVYGGVVLTSVMGGDLGSDLWEYDLNNNAWTLVHTDISPPLVAKHIMVYAPSTALVYLFGGSKEVIYSDDHIIFEFWSYDPFDQIWSNLNLVK
ncbi:MAG: hypothetical protein IZT55_05035 [Anaerolineae bacterium]|nr:hypothetical protein [Anaerolineae bacterium]